MRKFLIFLAMGMICGEFVKIYNPSIIGIIAIVISGYTAAWLVYNLLKLK